MKTILEYLVNNHINHNYAKSVLRIPRVQNFYSNNNKNDDEDIIITGEQYIKSPKEFIIYKDNYRGNMPHIAHLSDGLINILTFSDDSEDISPDRIIFSSDSLVECIRWLLEQKINPNDLDDAISKCDDYDKSPLENIISKAHIKTCDKVGWMAEVLYAASLSSADEKRIQDEQTKQFEYNKNDLYDRIIAQLKSCFTVKYK